MTDHEQRLHQTAPFPFELEDLVARLRYRPGWTFALGDMVRDPAESHGADAGGLTFVVTTKGYDSYHPDRGDTYRVHHYFVVPAATYNRASWLRWLLDCLLKVEQHECCEFFALTVDCCTTFRSLGSHISGCPGPFRDDHPFAPLHGPGEDPYVIHELATDEQRRTRFTGEVRA